MAEPRHAKIKGSCTRSELCGCTVEGQGTLWDPLRVRYCGTVHVAQEAEPEPEQARAAVTQR